MQPYHNLWFIVELPRIYMSVRPRNERPDRDVWRVNERVSEPPPRVVTKCASLIAVGRGASGGNGARTRLGMYGAP